MLCSLEALFCWMMILSAFMVNAETNIKHASLKKKKKKKREKERKKEIVNHKTIP